MSSAGPGAAPRGRADVIHAHAHAHPSAHASACDGDWDQKERRG